MAPVPQSILRALSLSLDPSKSSLSTSGLGSGFSNTGRIRAWTSKTKTKNTKQDDALDEVQEREQKEGEEEQQYFVKTSPDGQEMFQGEFASLNAIADIVPGFCPRALAWGALDDDTHKKGGYFLVTEFLDLSGRGTRKVGKGKQSSLAYRLGKLHSTPAPSPPPSSLSEDQEEEEEEDINETRKQYKFGFPVPTYCGDSRQPNNFSNSWSDFYANERLLMILQQSERRNGSDPGLRDLVSKTANVVVPRLLGDEHLGFKKDGKEGNGIVPVVVHGDLWSGNASRGRIVGSSVVDSDGNEEEKEEVADVVYDPSACYAHSEYELGIMHMFGGFGSEFFDEYHSIVPKTEPVEEYEDRIRLYELYHHLNHHAIFGGGYRSGAVSIMTKLISKYGRD